MHTVYLIIHENNKYCTIFVEAFRIFSFDLWRFSCTLLWSFCVVVDDVVGIAVVVLGGSLDVEFLPLFNYPYLELMADTLITRINARQLRFGPYTIPAWILTK